MRLGVLFSGGKDSTLALHRATATDEVVCLVTVVPDNVESYFFHTPNLHLTALQAEALGLPLVRRSSAGVEEEEVADLAAAVRQARDDHGIEGIVSGAVESVYQATRVQRVCDDLGLWCFNPLWQLDQLALLREVVEDGYEVEELEGLWRSHGINPAGEGGELETTVLDAPMFSERIQVASTAVEFGRDSGVLHIEQAGLVVK